MTLNLRQLKITTVGDGMVGKTCMLITYTENEFPLHFTLRQIIFDNRTCDITVDGEVFALTLWDTAAQEDYDRLRPLIYPDTDCFLVCYSIDCRTSLENVLSKWYPEIQRFSEDIPIILVGTKSDLRVSKSSECVTLAEADELKNKIQASASIQCSAKEKRNLDDVFHAAVRAILQRPSVKPRRCSIL